MQDLGEMVVRKTHRRRAVSEVRSSYRPASTPVPLIAPRYAYVTVNNSIRLSRETTTKVSISRERKSVFSDSRGAELKAANNGLHASIDRMPRADPSARLLARTQKRPATMISSRYNFLYGLA
jgi:hypothetical protein